MNQQNNSPQTPKISVIIPCYNSELHLKTALESLKKQTFKNFEIVIIDDGSTDATYSLAEQYQQATALDIVLASQSNQGVSVARNYGLSLARGTFVAFLDSDDAYHPEFLQKLYEGITLETVDVAYCLYTRKTLNDKKAALEFKQQTEMFDDYLYREQNIAFPVYLYKKSLLDQHAIEFNPSYRYGEDNEFVWKYLAHCRQGVFIARELYYYYDNPSSTMKQVTWAMTDAILAIEAIKKYYQQVDLAYSASINDYLIPRTIWSVGKNFAMAGDRHLFDKWADEFEIKHYMHNLRRAKPFIVNLTSTIYSLSPTLFFYFFKIVGRLISLIKG